MSAPSTLPGFADWADRKFGPAPEGCELSQEERFASCAECWQAAHAHPTPTLRQEACDAAASEREALAGRFQDFVSFLCGASEIDGVAFGAHPPMPPDGRPRQGCYWWRTALRSLEKEIVAALAASPALAPHASQAKAGQDEQDLKDAERYRWLRDVGDATWRPFGIREGYSAKQADDAIDTAMASTQGSKP